MDLARGAGRHCPDRAWGRGALLLALLAAAPWIAGRAAAEGTETLSREADVDRMRKIEDLLASVRRSFRDVPFVTAEELVRLQESETAVVVDVRTDEERAVSMLPGALSLEEFEGRKKEYRAKTIVTYCTIGYRSGEAARALIRQGFDAKNLKGGVLLWTHAGQPLVDVRGEPTRRLHVYGEKWNLVRAGYEAVW